MQFMHLLLHRLLSRIAADLITVLEHLKAAVPDFSWNHQTDGGKDEAGFATVTFKVAFSTKKWKTLV